MARRTDQIDKLAEWLTDFLYGPIRVSVLPLLLGADGDPMAGPMALDVHLAEPYDSASVLGVLEDTVFTERYLTLPYEGGHLVITESEFESASLVDSHLGQIMVYMVGVALAFQKDADRSDSSRPSWVA